MNLQVDKTCLSRTGIRSEGVSLSLRSHMSCWWEACTIAMNYSLASSSACWKLVARL